MVQILPKENDWGEAFRSLGQGVTQGYQNRADEMALQNAIGGLGANPTPRQILDAVTRTQTYSPQAKQNLFKNYLGAAEFEELQKQHQETVNLQKEKKSLKRLEPMKRNAKRKPEHWSLSTRQSLQMSRNKSWLPRLKRT